MKREIKETYDCLNLIKTCLEDFSNSMKNVLMNKWVAYKREGMEQILHGKIIDFQNCFHVKKKNGNLDFINIDNIIDIFDNKQDCYKMQ